eukprot:TRINITY_DN11695_c0_g1::TRINITY_DN11695_c0_g1_i1::g.17595::m.17595 TRINITY_DN11695_c0_g1::TRINITY_DN11695_c0_g1_i1::g.17595  ORF type:complete len:180 (+),score=29.97,PLAC8/PF04749.12/3.2e-08 TRINITY_DN11695_c0_g1_i1:61-540(+)
MTSNAMAQENNWEFGLFGCLSYKNSDGKQVCCPNFFPKGVNAPCCLFGANVTLLNDEEYVCDNFIFNKILQTGPRGCLCCLIGLPIAASPLPVSPPMAIVTVCQRRQIMNKYNIPGGCCEMMKGLCYPCALVQHNAFLYEQKKKKNNNVPPHAQTMARS